MDDEERTSLVPKADDLLTPREVCAVLRISPSTLRTWDAHLPPVRLPSGHRRYRRSEVEAIARGEHQAEAVGQ